MDYKKFVIEAEELISKEVPIEYRYKLRKLLHDDKTDDKALSQFGKSLDFNNIDFNNMKFGVGVSPHDIESTKTDTDNDTVFDDKPKEKRGYWDYVQHEIYKFICTDSEEYKKLREGAHEITTKIIPGLAATMATQLGGVDVGIITTMIVWMGYTKLDRFLKVI